MKKYINFLFLTPLLILNTSYLFGQGSIPISKDKSFTGALEFLPNGKLAEGFSRVKMSMPNEKDPLIDPQKWYTDVNGQMRGMVDDAVLFLQWWTTASSPAERHRFDWTSSGYFEVTYPNEFGVNTTKTINRYKLEKYPNLLKRFDNLTPTDITFEINFRSADISGKDYNDFRNRYKIMETLGSAGYAVTYTKMISGGVILYYSTGKKGDWSNPGVTSGSWNIFLNMEGRYKGKESRLIELFKMGRSIAISNFKMTNIKWQMSDFVYIAKKFTDYETGKDKPTAFDEVDDGEKKNKGGDGSWDDTDLLDFETEIFQNKANSKYGLRTTKGRILKEGQYDRIEKSGKQKYYMASKGTTINILNNLGSEVYKNTLSSTPSFGQCPNGNFWVNETLSEERIGDYNYFIGTGKKYIFKSEKLAHSFKWYKKYQPNSLGSILISSSTDNRSWQKKEADEQRKEAEEKKRKEDRDRIVQQRTSSLKSNGYLPLNSSDCE